MPWIKAGDTLPSIKGSDHCPVFVDFHDEITTADGNVVRLQDALGMGSTKAGVIGGEGHAREEGGIAKRDPPRLCAKYWDEFSGKQMSLAQFFGGGKGKVPTATSGSGTSSTRTSSTSTPTPTLSNTPTPTPASVAPTSAEPREATSLSDLPPAKTLATSTSTKRKFAPEPANSTKKVKVKEKIQKAGQQSIASFFAKPSASTSSAKGKQPTEPSSSQSHSDHEMDVDGYDQEDEDYKLALQLSQEYSSQSSIASPSNGSGNGKQKEKAKDAWTSLLAPTQPPTCRAHNEPAKEYTVNKPGPNKGKKFFICSRYAISPFNARPAHLLGLFEGDS